MDDMIDFTNEDPQNLLTTPASTVSDGDYGPIWERYRQIIPSAGYFEQKEFRAWITMYPEDWIIAALAACERQGSKGAQHSYLEAIIRRYALEGGPKSSEMPKSKRTATQGHSESHTERCLKASQDYIEWDRNQNDIGQMLRQKRDKLPAARRIELREKAVAAYERSWFKPPGADSSIIDGMELAILQRAMEKQGLLPVFPQPGSPMPSPRLVPVEAPVQ